VFDPFGDFESKGYLRNVEGLKDPAEVKIQEHVFFEANLEDALGFLAQIRSPVTYADFLEVHRILFADFYPWAGCDRHQLGVGRLIGKGSDLQFEVSELCQRAVEWGLRIGNDVRAMTDRPGEVLGAFAWGHPFLDGNGRTMLLVHGELCHRAGITINWAASAKDAYLRALTQELQAPQGRHLDRYLRPLIGPIQGQGAMLKQLRSLPGLDGAGAAAEPDVAYGVHDAEANQRYLDMKKARREGEHEAPP
jgi:cell filamentation protein